MGEVEPRSLESARIYGSIEQVVLENGAMRVIVLPSLGGKIASIQILPSEEELLQQPLQPYARRTRYMNFDGSDASGWDECLPSVAACEVSAASGPVSIPDHGDFWQVEWQTVSQSETEVTMSADGFSLPLRFSKILRLDRNRLHVSYALQNLSSKTVEYIWSAHPLFAVEQGDHIVLPDSIKEVIVEGSAQNRLGKQGTTLMWPKATPENQKLSDLTVTGKVTDAVGDKLFAASPLEGWCAIERKRLNCRIELYFDPKRLPYLGLWICYGGWPEHKANRQQCVALEPCTALGDSLATAVSQGRARRLDPEAKDHWSLELQVGGVS
jgi:galactose mutarotase-like enzyme